MREFTTKALRTRRTTEVILMWGYGRFRGGLSGLWFFFLLTLAAVTRAQSPDYSPGYEQYKHGHFDSAVVSFSQLISEQPVKKEGYYNRGLSYFHLNKFTEAKAIGDPKRHQSPKLNRLRPSSGYRDRLFRVHAAPKSS